MVAVYDVDVARLAVGSKLTVLPYELNATVPRILVPPLSKVNVFAVMVDLLIASLNVAVMVEVTGTPVSPLFGFDT